MGKVFGLGMIAGMFLLMLIEPFAKQFGIFLSVVTH